MACNKVMAAIRTAGCATFNAKALLRRGVDPVPRLARLRDGGDLASARSTIRIYYKAVLGICDHSTGKG